MDVHVTQRCHAHGHAEITVQTTRALALPLHEWLTSYFESAVASGTKFLAGQTVQFGWSTLRLCTRTDGTLGVEERVREPGEAWIERVDHALMDLYLQREVVRSFGWELEHVPHQMQDAMVHECALQRRDIVLTRHSIEGLPETFSGWSVACAQAHDHGEAMFIPLLGVAAQLPVVTQLLALPPGSTTLVMWKPIDGQLRVSPHVLYEGEERVPEPGSYVASLQSG